MDSIIESIDIYFENVVSSMKTYQDLSEPYLLQSQDLQMFIAKMMDGANSTHGAINFQYKMPSELKEYLLYLREAALQFQKANIKYLQGLITKTQLDNFRADLISSCTSVTSNAQSSIKQILESPVSERDKEYYSEINSPFETYKKQFAELASQVDLINTIEGDVKISIPLLDKIRQLLTDEVNELQTSFNYLNKIVESLVQFSTKGEVNSKDNFKSFSQSNAEIQKMFLAKSNLDFELDQLLGKMTEELKIPEKSNGGRLKVRQLRFRESIKEWLRIEVLPEIYEARELNDEMINAIKASSGNMFNRISISFDGGDESFNTNVFNPSLIALQKRHEQLNKDAVGFLAEVKQKVDDKLKINALFDKEAVIASSNWMSSMDATVIEEAPIIKSARRFGRQLKVQFQGLIDQLFDKHKVNVSETLIEYVKSLDIDLHSPYNNIFLTKSFSGKSFYVRRTAKHDLAHRSIKNWEEGFRGSMLVTGVRYSGKSSFINALLDELRSYDEVVLMPNADTNYAGRKFAASKNLGEHLASLKNYYTGKKTIVAIDDIMKWDSKEVSFIENVKALNQFINANDAKFYVIVGISDIALRTLDPQLSLSNVFNTVLDLSKSRIEEVFQIIKVRHGSTHKQLVYREEQVATPDVFRKYIKHVYKETEGVVGDILNLWALGIELVGDDMVRFTPIYRKTLPDFITEENSIVLKAFALHKRLNEYQLRTIIGPAFNEKYKQILNRLIGVGLLYREGATDLTFNEMIANQITDKLKCESYI